MRHRRLAGAENNTGRIAQCRQQQRGVGKVGHHARRNRLSVQRLTELINLLNPRMILPAEDGGQVDQRGDGDAFAKQRRQALPDSGVL